MTAPSIAFVKRAQWALAASACMLLAACGGGGDEDSAGSAPMATTIASATTTSDTTALGNKKERCNRYEFTDLGTLGGTQSGAAAINESGSIVGYSYMPGDLVSHAVLWVHGKTIDLGTLGGSSSSASDINDDGQIVGSSTLPGDQTTHATLWSRGKIHDLGAASALSSSAAGINNAGQVVGSTHLGTAHDVAILWNGKATTQLSPVGGANSPWISSIATEINDKGLIIGFSGTRFYDDHGATSWTGQQPTKLDGTGDSIAYGVNNAGTIVGMSGFHPGFPGSATVWNGTTATLLTGLFADPLGRYAASASAINDVGQIVGWSATNANIDAHAVLWNDARSAPVDLNDYLDMNDIGAGWVLTSASGINGKGWIVGASKNTLTGQFHGFLLSLVPERDTSGHGNQSRRRGVLCDSDL